MTRCKTFNVKLCCSQLNNKSKSGIKSGNEVTLNLSSNVIGSSNDEYNFPNNLLLTNTQVSRLRINLRAFEPFANNSIS